MTRSVMVYSDGVRLRATKRHSHRDSPEAQLLLPRSSTAAPRPSYSSPRPSSLSSLDADRVSDLLTRPPALSPQSDAPEETGLPDDLVAILVEATAAEAAGCGAEPRGSDARFGRTR